MAIKPQFTEQELKKELMVETNRIEQTIINRFAYIGEKAVSYARSLTPSEGSFTNRTGILRSSIGFAIFNKGTLVRISSFSSVKNGSNGAAMGKTFVKSLSGLANKGIVLAVVAGADYAFYVESIYNKDVISGSELVTKKELVKFSKFIKSLA